MRNLFAGAATLAIAAVLSAPAMAQTMQSDPAVTGVAPGGTPLVASACNEPDFARTQSLIEEGPQDLRPALMQRLDQARDFGQDRELQQCAQELARIESILEARSAAASGTTTGMTGSSGAVGSDAMTGSSLGTTGAVGAAGAVGTAGAAAAMGSSRAPVDSGLPDPAVAASCNEGDIAEVENLIDQAPESQQAELMARLDTARDLGSDQENLECAQTLADIRQIVQGTAGSSQ